MPNEAEARAWALMQAQLRERLPPGTNPGPDDVFAILALHVAMLEAREAREQPAADADAALRRAMDEFGHPAILAAELRAWREIARQLMQALTGVVGGS